MCNHIYIIKYIHSIKYIQSYAFAPPDEHSGIVYTKLVPQCSYNSSDSSVIIYIYIYIYICSYNSSVIIDAVLQIEIFILK